MLAAPQPNRFFATAWSFFLVAAFLGVGLRALTLWPTSAMRYAYLLHTHSHIAMLGWVFNAFFALGVCFFIQRQPSIHHSRLFVFLQFAVIGMLFSYPFQGYGSVSIAFSTLHLIGWAIFGGRLWRQPETDPASRATLRIALLFLILSALGPLALGPLAATGFRDSSAYSLAIYFYLHCQYNGWFPFFLQATLWHRAAQQGHPAKPQQARPALACLGVGAILTFALSTLWLSPPDWVAWTAFAGGIIQLAGALLFFRSLPPAHALFRVPAARRLALLAGCAFILKLSLQIAGALPTLAAFTNQRFLVIGFLHWVFLAVVTPLLIAWAIELGWIRWNRIARIGTAVLLMGAALTEATLAYPTFASWFGLSGGVHINTLLFGGAVCMAAGVFALTFTLAGRRQRERVDS